MKKDTSSIVMVIVNGIAILWLVYVATFNTAIKYIPGTDGTMGSFSIVPYEHVIFPILALLLSLFFFIRNVFTRRDRAMHGRNA